jgi:hypothetical protein
VFAFVEFEEKGDCQAAILNCNQSEINGATIKVSQAQKNQLRGDDGNWSKQPIW